MIQNTWAHERIFLCETDRLLFDKRVGGFLSVVVWEERDAHM